MSADIDLWNFCGCDGGMARPRKPKKETRENILRVRLTDDERKLLDEAARKRSLETSTWARSELVALARALRERR